MVSSGKPSRRDSAPPNAGKEDLAPPALARGSTPRGKLPFRAGLFQCQGDAAEVHHRLSGDLEGAEGHAQCLLQ